MFYKVRGISKKTGLGTVNVVHRDEQGKETLRSTGVSVNPKYFNTKTGKITPRDPLYPEKNAKIQAVAADFETAIRNLNVNGLKTSAQAVQQSVDKLRFKAEAQAWFKPYQDKYDLSNIDNLRADISDLKAELQVLEAQLLELERAQGIVAVEKPIFFLDKLEEYKEVLKAANIKLATIKNYTSTATVVKRFRAQLQMKEINLKLLQDFQNYLIKLGRKNGTITEIFIRFLAVYKHYAAEDELNLPTAFIKKFKRVEAKQDTNVIILIDEEIAEIEALEIKTRGQHRTRECFLYCMETGLRWSDIPQGRVHVQDGFMLLPTSKTGKQIEVPLSKKALAILERNDYKFSRPSESQYNKALQAMGKKCPLLHKEIQLISYVGNKVSVKLVPKWKKLTSHLGRKKFINTALEKEVTLLSIAEIVGHTTTKTIEQHYANKKLQVRREAHKLMD